MSVEEGGNKPQSKGKKSYGTLPSSPFDSLVEEELKKAEIETAPQVTASLGLTITVILVALLLLLGFITTGYGQNSLQKFSKLIDSVRPTFSSGESPLTDTTTTISTTITSTTTTTTSKPNFIVIVADDLGWNSLGYSDDSMAFATPILTNLARKGIVMNNFYAQEVCSPSRASLLTGRYPLSAGMQYGMVAATAEWGLSLDEVLLPEVLKDESYSTYMLGKWHLGYFSPMFLPTARGFDEFTGYVNGENYYWSKRSPDYPEFVDFMTSDRECYQPYNGSDRHDYSTVFYTNKALSIIDSHPAKDPLFLYLAYQAVHDPFIDVGKFSKGMPDEFLPDDVLSEIHSSVIGTHRKEYVKSLYIMDKSIGQIVSKLEEKGIMDNTYLIFMSDNGGCFYGGGKNGPLRGSKGSLFEGGIKVDSFIYSPKLSSSTAGTVYDGLMHISDWFPTMLALAGITYEADSDHPLDGVNQLPGWMGQTTPRASILYNFYTALTDYSFNIWYNGSFAVRDGRYKLMHTYNDSDFGAWYQPSTLVDGDDELDADNRCAQQFLKGDFVYWLFDLEEDPYEYTNLYDSDVDAHVQAKEKLYTLLPGYLDRAKTKISIQWSNRAKVHWQEHGNYIMPWANEANLKNSGDHPVYCG